MSALTAADKKRIGRVYRIEYMMHKTDYSGYNHGFVDNLTYYDAKRAVAKLQRKERMIWLDVQTTVPTHHEHKLFYCPGYDQWRIETS